MKRNKAKESVQQKLKKLIEQAYASQLRLSELMAERFAQEQLLFVELEQIK